MYKKTRVQKEKSNETKEIEERLPFHVMHTFFSVYKKTYYYLSQSFIETFCNQLNNTEPSDSSTYVERIKSITNEELRDLEQWNLDNYFNDAKFLFMSLKDVKLTFV